MKKLIILILFTLSSITYGQLSQINVGTSANDGTGESLRSAFQKVNLGITQINTNTDSLKLKLNKVDTLTLSNRINAKLDITSAISYPGSGIPLSTGSAWGTSITNNSSNWNTAYSDRLKWDGGSTGLTAATGRTSLGGTTAGQALFTLTNPSAITFLRVNADNSVTALSAANFRTATATVGTADTASMLEDYINKADTALMLSKYLLITDTAGMGGGTSSYDSTYIHYRVDSIVTVLSDTILGSSVFMELADIKPYYTFGAGTGAAADSTLFAKGNKSFGSFRIIEDSLYVHSITNLYMTSGDSLRFNVYFGNGMTRTATDSLFTAPQGAGSYATQTLTPDNERTINHGQDVWVGIIGPQPANMRPKEWILQLNAKIVRD